MKKLVFILFLISTAAFAQPVKIVLKLNSKVTPEILNNFNSGNAKSGSNSLANICKLIDLSNLHRLFPSQNKSSDFNLDRIFISEVSSDKLNYAILILKSNEYIEYVEKVGKRKLYNFIPNDPYYSSQYHLDKINMPQCWDVTLGDTSVVIGVIDSGLDFDHPDLLNSFRINYGEYGNGKEHNGFDDDNDGYIDNWRGWNFVNNTNNPTDDNLYSHGTSVTGLIAAGFNNGIGISSISPNCKVLVLKAFDVNGQGEDDNVAAAIIYGVNHGAKILNMSFGDYVYSYLLRDVIRFAYSRNVVMISSAGNDNSDLLHFPSAFDEVISVGASTSADSRASFSSFGETVDLFAPGSSILTTSIRGKGDSQFENNYQYSSGTSFSAPITSAVSALLLSKNKNLTNEEVRGILVSSTDYFPSQSEWNHQYSSGKLNAFSCINNFDKPSIVRIYFPFQNLSTYSANIPVYVSAVSSFFQSYCFSYGVGENPASFNNLFPVFNYQTIKDTIGFWNLSGLPDTSYTLRLSVMTQSGRTIEHRQIIKKDAVKPLILEYDTLSMVNENSYINLVSFTTNKPTLGKIFYKRNNVAENWNYVLADYGANNNGFVSTVHYGFLDNKNLYSNTLYNCYIEVISENGLKDTSGVFNFLTSSEIYQYGVTQKNYTFTNVQTYNSVVDIFGTGKKDVFVNIIQNNLQLELYEFGQTGFIKISDNNWGSYYVARDVFKLSNGKTLLLTNKTRNGELYESQSPNGLPTNLIWSDEGNDNFWSSRFADCDNDGNIEIIGFGKTGLRILEYNGTAYNEIASLPYLINNSEPNSQNVLVDDFDNDGKKEIIFTLAIQSQTGILGTKVLVYRCVSNNTFQLVTSADYWGIIKGDNFTSGDIDGDGMKEIILGSENTPDDLVSQLRVFVFKLQSNQLNFVTDKIFYSKNAKLLNSTRCANLDGIQGDEISLCSGGNYYILKYSSSGLNPVFYKAGISSYNQLIYDFDINGINEIGLNTIADTLLFYEMNANVNRPAVPTGISGIGIDSNKVFLKFNTIQGVTYYKIYRSLNDTNYILYDSTSLNSYYDNNVVNRVKYYYRISSVDLNSQIKESELSNSIPVFVHRKSKLSQVNYQNGGYIILRFSEKVSFDLPQTNSILINDFIPVSVVLYDGFSYLVSIGKKLINGNTYTVKTNSLKDFYNSDVDTNSLQFQVVEIDTASFYIKSASVIDNKKIKVEFNFSVDENSAKNILNYTFTPFNFTVLNINVENNNPKIIYITLGGNGSIGASGKNYNLKISNVFSSLGLKITSGSGSSYSFVFVKDNLENVITYPNPYKPSLQSFITFANLTKTAVIYIYNISGNYINKIEENDGNGGVEWNLKDIYGNDIPTGIYIFRATGKDSNGNDVEEKIGKFAVIR